MTPTTSRTPPSTTTTTVNEVHVVGRITTEPTERELPSGDVLVALRVSVPRDPPPRRTDPEGRAHRVDALDLACWTGVARRAALRAEVGDQVEVWGSLRRRFFRTPGGVQSRYEIEVDRIRKVRVGGSDTGPKP